MVNSGEMLAAAVVLLALFTLVYVLIGYPLLLGWWSRRFARPVKRAPIRPTISVIIPVFNGEAFLADKLESVLALHYPRELMEIFVALRTVRLIAPKPSRNS